MKFKILALAFLASSPVSFGTMITVTNYSEDPSLDLPIFDNAGIAFSPGTLSIIVGNFGGGAPNLGLHGFNQFSTTIGTNDYDLGLGTPTGFFNLRFQVPSIEAGDFLGEEIYVVISDGFSSAIWKGPTVNPDIGSVEGSTNVKVILGSGTLEVGELLTPPPSSISLGDLGEVEFENGIQLVVPEPSLSLLSVLAGICFLGRRRRG